MSEINFECPTFLQRLKGMLGVDFYRLFHTPMFYIFLGIAAIIPAMILGTMGMENPQTGEISSQLYTNVRHIIAAEKPLYVVNDIAEYANMNMIFIFGGIMVSIFIGHDYKSGYVISIISKTFVCSTGGALMILGFFSGTMLGSAISGLPFEMIGFNIGNLVMQLFINHLVSSSKTAIRYISVFEILILYPNQ